MTSNEDAGCVAAGEPLSWQARLLAVPIAALMGSAPPAWVGSRRTDHRGRRGVAWMVRCCRMRWRLVLRCRQPVLVPAEVAGVVQMQSPPASDSAVRPQVLDRWCMHRLGFVDQELLSWPDDRDSTALCLRPVARN